MTVFCTQEDVVKRLRRPLNSDETEYLDGLIEEAQALVVAHLGCGPDRYEQGDVPVAIRITTSRMVARVLQQSENMDPAYFGAVQVGTTAGPYSEQTTFHGESRLGSPWLSKTDRESLAPYKCGTKAFSVDTAPIHSTIHSETCSANRYIGAEHWYAYCDCGADIAGKPIY